MEDPEANGIRKEADRTLLYVLGALVLVIVLGGIIWAATSDREADTAGAGTEYVEPYDRPGQGDPFGPPPGEPVDPIPGQPIEPRETPDERQEADPAPESALPR
jgi:hypothetical protein